MKKYIYFTAGCVAFIIFYVLLTGYGNKIVHPNINYSIINEFYNEVLEPAGPYEKFNNYTFRFNRTGGYNGVAITEPGVMQVKEETVKMNMLNWVIHGGFSADEPELPASFRHFYNPTKPKGERYLMDYLDVFKKTDYFSYITHVEVDHLEWALDHVGHEYNWENGKEMMVKAFTYMDPNEKKEAIAFAFRALGETLHMIADMGCPAHVRDDAHPGWTSVVSFDLGSPDPYEEYMEKFTDIENLFAKGKADPVLRSKFHNAKTLSEIAVPLAEYTNWNFFTGQTIYGNKTTPIIHQGVDFFRSPWLDDCRYDNESKYYIKEISGVDVKMCSDKSSFFKKSYPYIDKECARSQASVLIPQILQAGSNVIRLFIPEIEVKCESLDETSRTLKGTIEHKPDSEYPEMFLYTGDVLLYDAGTNKEIAKGLCLTGEFEIELTQKQYNAIDWENKGVYALTWVGDFFVSSEVFNKSDEIEEEEDEDYCEIGSVKYYYTESGQLNLEDKNLSTLPDCIDGFVNISQFNIRKNTIKTIPSSIGSLTNLTYLNLSQNQLTTLPESIGHLIKVGQIDAQENNLISLPSSIGDMEKLGILRLDDNSLTNLPDNITSLKRLYELRVTNNQLTSLPSNIGALSNLESLYLWNNKLKEIPASIGNLENLVFLSLAQNQLGSIPSSIGTLKKLRKLYLNSNQLTDLPEEIKNLSENLEELYMGNNKIDEFDDETKARIHSWLPKTKIYWRE